VKQDYCKGLAEFFEQAYKQNGGEVVKEQSYSTGDKDFKAQLTSIKSTKPDAIYVPGYYTEVALIARQAKQLGLKVPLLGGDGWVGDSLITVAGPSIEGSFFSNHYSEEDQSPVIQEFVKKYKDKYGSVPDAMAALGYDSAKILADAIKRAGTTESAKLRDAIAGTKDFKAVTGTITLDDHRNATKPAVMMTIKDGKFEYVETVSP
jgi:branched-chain amino acid transport system substrate-binding protein